jgi:polysaccharide deacetylase 2 family uncharacterized protein YibQ
VPSRRLHRRKKKVLLATAVLLPLVVGVILLALYLRPGPKHLSEFERRAIAGRFRETIERVGGTQVWVKASPYAAFPPARIDSPAEVLVVPVIFDAVLTAVKRRAEGEDLRVSIKITQTKERWHVVDIQLARGREPAGRWRLREVGQLRRAAVIIDDLGHDLEAARKLLSLPYPITFSVLPHLSHSAVTAEEAHRAGREVMLHLPMEPDSSAQPGKGEIRIGMRASEVERIIAADLASVPYAVGVNNHMGSRATTQVALMGEVMAVLAERRLYFVDSRTTAASIAFDAARRKGLPCFYRSIFLDDTETVTYTARQLREFRRAIEGQGAALAIGHPYPTTLTALARFLPELEEANIQLVPTSQLLQLPEVPRLTPPRPTNP